MPKRVGKNTPTTQRTRALIALWERDGRSLVDLAKRIGRDNRSIVSEWKAGRSEPDVDDFAKLCYALGKKVDEVIALDEATLAELTAKPEPLIAAVEHLDAARRLIAEAQEAEALARLARAGEGRTEKGSTRPKSEWYSG
jgi:transcriptional regulator with XRE-family HTH domain